MDIASLIILGKVLLGLDKDPCANMIVGSPAHIQCLIVHRKK